MSQKTNIYHILPSLFFDFSLIFYKTYQKIYRIAQKAQYSIDWIFCLGNAKHIRFKSL